LRVAMGATIPIGAVFKKHLGADTIFFSFSTTDEDYHAPNEYFRMSSFRTGLIAWTRLFHRLADQWLQGASGTSRRQWRRTSGSWQSRRACVRRKAGKGRAPHPPVGRPRGAHSKAKWPRPWLSQGEGLACSDHGKRTRGRACGGSNKHAAILVFQRRLPNRSGNVRLALVNEVQIGFCGCLTVAQQTRRLGEVL
jgi:hypothetical protein